MRLFVAIELPADWLLALRTAQDDLKGRIEALAGPRLRWVRPEAIHLTLKFLGEVAESRLPSVFEAITRATAPMPELTLAMGRAGSFGDRRGPRVIWAGVDGATVGDRQRLYQLAEALETWLASAGFKREGRFSPHLTLARLPDDLSREQRALVGEASAGLAPAAGRASGGARREPHAQPPGARRSALRAHRSLPRLALFPLQAFSATSIIAPSRDAPVD